MSKDKVGLIGVGLLGAALAERLIAAGHQVLGFDIDANQMQRLCELGGEAADGVRSVAENCRRILLCLPNADIVRSVVDELQHALTSESLIVDTTTGDPQQTIEVAKQLNHQGVGYVDATVLGSSAQAREGQVIVMAGGDEQDLARCSDLLESFAARVFYVGPSGSGAKMKLVVNLVLGLNRAALAEGLSLAKSAGIDLATALEILRSGAAYSAVMDTKGHKMIERDFAPQARLAQHLKDVDLILDMARQLDLPLPLSAVHRKLLERAVARGFAESDNSAIIAAFDRKR